MKKILPFITALILVLASCNSSKNATNKTDLEGKWQLTYISGPEVAFESLYPDKKPFIQFNLAEQRFTGNSSCNNYSGPLLIKGRRIDFTVPIILTKMFCQGQGESVYMETLKTANRWKIQDGILTLSMGNVELMRFSKN